MARASEWISYLQGLINAHGAVLLIQAIVPAPETEPTHTTDKQMPRAYGPARRKKW